MELVCIIVSTITAIFSAFAAFFSYLSGKSMAQGNIELQIRQMISEAEYKILDCLENSSENLEALKENLLTCYEEACAKYIDNKLDKKRFKEMYSKEIKNLIKSSAFKDQLNPQTTVYTSILHVYKEWFSNNR